jgi:hypothetical protein
MDGENEQRVAIQFCFTAGLSATETLVSLIKPNRCTNLSNLFLEWNSTCFGQFLCPSTGVFALYTQQWYMSYRFADSLWAGSGWNWFSSVAGIGSHCVQVHTSCTSCWFIAAVTRHSHNVRPKLCFLVLPQIFTTLKNVSNRSRKYEWNIRFVTRTKS